MVDKPTEPTAIMKPKVETVCRQASQPPVPGPEASPAPTDAGRSLPAVRKRQSYFDV